MSALSLRAAARDAPDACALVGEDGEAWSYAEVAERARRVDLERPLHPLVGEPTSARALEALAAIDRAVPIGAIHPRWTDAERSDVRASLRAADLPEGTLAVLHTSGTSGRPRGAILSRRAFEAAARASAHVIPLATGDRWLLCMPIAHVGGLSILVRSLIARSAVIVAGAFDVERTLAAIARDRPTVISLVPTMLARLLDAGLAPSPQLRAVLLGGAACSERVLARAIARGLPIHTTYGLTEACSQVTTARVPVRSSEDGAGEPLPGVELRIARSTGTILVRAPQLLDGWIGAGAVVPALDADGFYDTGDLGAIDAAGRLHVLARRSDLVVTGGENVYPAEVERALERVPGVGAACVFGVPDEQWGQLVAAAIVGDARDDEIARALEGALARFKIPRRLARLDALSTTAAGKLDRTATAARAAPLLRTIAREPTGR